MKCFNRAAKFAACSWEITRFNRRFWPVALAMTATMTLATTSWAAKPTPPAAPSGLTAGAASSSQINLAWNDNSTNESGFKIERAPSASGTFTQIATVGANVRSYSNPGLSASTTYYYRVRAYNKWYNSTYSNTAGATTQSTGDTTPPTVSITSPASGTAYTTAQTVTINASASDNVGVTKVEFYDGGVLKGTDTTSPYSYAWAISSSLNGTHSWTAKAYDAAGNTKVSTAVSLTVNIPTSDTAAPSTPTGLTATAVSSSQINLSWNASTDTGGSGLAGYKVYRAGVQIATTTTTSYSNTGLSANTSYCYTVAAYDNAGNTSSQSSQACATTQTAASDTTPPTVSMTAPAGGSVVKGTITLSASASDNVGVTKVDFYRDAGVLIATDTTAPYSVSFNTTTVTGGSHSFYAKASDAANNVATSGSVYVTVDNTMPTVSLTAPSNGSTVSGTITVSANASDNVAVARVDFYRDTSILIGSDTTSPYAVSHNTTGVADGSHAYHSIAVDAANNATSSSASTVTISNSVQNESWVLQGGGLGSDAGYATAADSSGNIIVVGSFTGSASFGGGSLTSSGDRDVFVAKYTTAGAPVWSKRFGGIGWDNAFGVCVDNNGDVLVTGAFSVSVDFGGGLLTSTGGRDIFLVKLSGSSGAHVWSKRIGGIVDDYAYGVAVHRPTGEIVIVGSFADGVNFGGGLLYSNSFGVDMFVAKYTASGGYLWVKNFNCGGADSAKGVAVDSNGNIAITGSVGASIDLGGGPLYLSGGMSDIVVGKFTPTGGHLWSKTLGGAGGDIGRSIAVDGSGNVLVTGSYQYNVSFGGETFSGSSVPRMFVVKLAASNGAHVWSKALDGDGYGVAVDSTGNAVATGSSMPSGNYDIHVIAYAGATGAQQWELTCGGTGSDIPCGIAADGAGGVVVTGYFSGTATFSGVPLTSFGSVDVFVLKLVP